MVLRGVCVGQVYALLNLQLPKLIEIIENQI
jgi:hypothetical protein